MSQTHQQIVKVWIAPGCIVCDACETECPEVFDVQEETCVIRPDATKAAFTQPLTPTIIAAAEACPVEVIKFETVDVEGPAPWAGQEAKPAAAAAVGADAGHTPKKAGWTPPEGPPDPHWAKLLDTAATSGSRSAGGPAVRVRPVTARATADDLAHVIPESDAPDAVSSLALASGYTRPRPSLAQSIRERTAVTRRGALAILGNMSTAAAIGWGALIATTATSLGAFQNFMVLRVTKEPPKIFRAGRITDYGERGVYEPFKRDQQVWIVNLGDRIVALSTICTHLGCIPNWLANDDKFKCPCHGSGFHMDGVHFEGPAPRPLERFRVFTEGDMLFVDKGRKFRQELGQWTDAASYVML